MAQQIWKFPLEAGFYTQPISLPRGAKPFTCQVQYGVPGIWAVCDPTADPVERTVRIVGTGWEIVGDAPLGEYIGTYQLDADGSSLMFHVFIGEEN